MGTGSFPGVKWPGRGVDHPPAPSARLKKEYNYTSTPPLGIRGLFWDEILNLNEKKRTRAKFLYLQMRLK